MQPRSWTFGALLVGLFALAPTAHANDVRINVDESGRQDEAAIVHQSTGEAFVVWGSNGNIVGRRFAADGTALDATDLLIGEGGQRPQIDMNDDGQAVIVWPTSDHSSSEVFARVVPFDGSPPSDVFMVNIVQNGAQLDPHVGVRPDGVFFVVYQSTTLDGSSSGIALRQFDASGMPLTGEVVVNINNTEGSQSFPALDMDSAGNFVVSWIDIETNGRHLRYFGSDGTPATAPIDSTGGFDQDIAYSNQSQVLMSYGFGDLSAAIYDSQGILQAGPFQINDDDQIATKSTVTALASGDFQVAWTQEPIGSNNKDIYTRTVLADGTLPDPPERANRTTGGVQAQAHIAASPNNGYTIVFQGPDSDNTGIFATCMQPDGCVEVFSDGFESGDVANWSGSMP